MGDPEPAYSRHSMSRALAIHNCSQLVTLAGPARPRVGPEMRDLGIIENGALLAIDGRIRATGSWDEVAPQIPDDAIVEDMEGRVVLPGFVDAHSHLVFGGNRAAEFEMRCEGKTYEAIAAAGGGILATVKATRYLKLDDLEAEGRAHLHRMSGSTTVEAKSGYGLTVEDELKLLRMHRRINDRVPVDIVSTALIPHALPPEYEGNATGYIERVAVPALGRIRQEGLAEFADAFVEEGYFDEETLRPYLQEAKRLGFNLRLHVDQLRNGGGAQLAARWGAKTADHLEHTDDAGIDALFEAGVMPVLLPGSVYGLGKAKYPDVRRMIEKGLPVVLATDFNPGSSPCSSMCMILSLACTQMKMTPGETLVAATINAAYSLDRGHDRGSLEPGKRADFVLHQAEDFREIPYWFGESTVFATWIEGR